MWEGWGSCLFSCNSCPPFGAHFFLPCSAATGTPSKSSFWRRRATWENRWSCNGYRCALRSSDRRAMYCGVHLMAFSPQNACLCFSILNYRYSALPVPANYVSFFALFNLRSLLYITSTGRYLSTSFLANL